MKINYKNQAVIVTNQYFQRVNFDVGTNKFFTQFNGLGGFNYFHYINNPNLNLKAESYFNIYIDDCLMDIFAKKKVINVGRTQKIILYLPQGKIIIDQFVDESTIFNTIKIKFKEAHKVVVVYDYTRFVDVPNLASNIKFEYCKDNYSYYLYPYLNKNKQINVAISFTENAKKILSLTRKISKKIHEEIAELNLPKNCSGELEKSLYTSCYFTALENYKELPDFKAFSAGVNYLIPFRTYYRDSYWTTLCLYQDHPELIKQQIITLAKGIKEDGECPSAVKADYTGFWGGHYDSPCFFVMMVFDYISHIDDKKILDLVVNKLTIRELCEKVIIRLMKLCDDTHLLVKKGQFNKLDWADAVNRSGYVTYDECLYYRALISLSHIVKNGDKYLKEAQIVKKSINRILFDKNKGYYINFIDGDYIEDNLSVDTILTVLFDIVETKNRKRLVDNFENILYSKNHKQLDDFGVMSVYPTYKVHNRTDSISSQAYRYHNGANWPYWSGMFAYMLMLEGRDYQYALTSWYQLNVKNMNLTPCEYFSPYYINGSDLQGWSSTSAFALQYCNKKFFLI